MKINAIKRFDLKTWNLQFLSGYLKGKRYDFIEAYSFINHNGNLIDVFPIIFDARGLRPDMLHFPRFFGMNLCIYSVTSQSQRKCHKANAGKT